MQGQRVHWTAASSSTKDDQVEAEWSAVTAGCSEARHRLVEYYMPFAKMLAAKQYAIRVTREDEFDDYHQWALEGLLEAIDRFDCARGVRFESFAAKRILGSILNNLEQHTERSAQMSARRRIRKERIDSLSRGLETDADGDSLFAQLADVAVGIALGIMLEGTGMFARESDSQCTAPEYCPYQSTALRQLQEGVQHSVESLMGQERTVIKYHYFFGFRFEQIASIMQVSKGRVSQIHKQALLNLRAAHRGNRQIDIVL